MRACPTCLRHFLRFSWMSRVPLVRNVRRWLLSFAADLADPDAQAASACHSQGQPQGQEDADLLLCIPLQAPAAPPSPGPASATPAQPPVTAPIPWGRRLPLLAQVARWRRRRPPRACPVRNRPLTVEHLESREALNNLYSPLSGSDSASAPQHRGDVEQVGFTNRPLPDSISFATTATQGRPLTYLSDDVVSAALSVQNVLGNVRPPDHGQAAPLTLPSISPEGIAADAFSGTLEVSLDALHNRDSAPAAHGERSPSARLGTSNNGPSSLAGAGGGGSGSGGGMSATQVRATSPGTAQAASVSTSGNNGAGAAGAGAVNYSQLPGPALAGPTAEPAATPTSTPAATSTPAPQLHSTVHAAGPRPAAASSAGKHSDDSAPNDKHDPATPQSSGVLSPVDPTINTTEGQGASGIVALFTDSDGNTDTSKYTASINWGDGTTSSGMIGYDSTSKQFQVEAGHGYADDGTFTIVTTITDSDGAITTVNSSAYVKDATLSFLENNFTRGTAVQGSTWSSSLGSFSDAYSSAPLSDYTALVNWGDGSTPTLGQIQNNGTLSVSGSHVFQTAGTFTVQVTVRDKGGASTSWQGTVTVNSPTLPFSAGSPAFVEGASATQVLVTFSDADNNSNAGSYQATATWGDGTPNSSLTVTYLSSGSGGSSFQISGTHTYAEDGPQPVQISLTDTPDNFTETIPISLEVADAALHASSASINATAGQTFQGSVATFTDVNPNGSASDFHASINWGDGTPATSGVVLAVQGGGFQVQGAHRYTSSGSRSVIVTINDAGGSYATVTSTATVGSAALQLNAITAVEGQAFSGSLGTFTPPVSGGSYSASIGWGDGSALSSGTLTSNGQGGYSITGTHTYADETPAESPYNVTVTIQPNAGTSGTPLSASTQATVNDAALTGSSVTLTAWTGTATGNAVVGTFTDANPKGSAADFTASINWGDNTTTQGTVQAKQGSGFQVVGNHTYTTANSYPLTVTVTDDGGTSITINSTATVATATASLQATEGQSFSGVLATLSGDPSQATSASIDWGDGSAATSGTITPVNGSSFTVSGSHTYAEEGSYPLTVTVQMSQGGPLTASGPATVNDAALSATAVNQAATVGQPLGANNSPVVLATFTDANPQGSVSDFTASIDWGDGSTSAGTVQTAQGGVFQVVGSHTYSNAGSYKAVVTINDDGGQQTTATSIISTALLEGQDYALSLTVAAPAGAGQQASSGTTYTALVNWGDGTSSVGTVSVVSGSGALQVLVTGDRVFTEEGTYNVSVTVSDPNNNQSTGSISVPVQDAPLSGGYGLPFTAITGAALSGVLVGGFSDQNLYGTASDFSVSISWGDGSGTDTSSGRVKALGQGSYQVSGGHTYTSAGSHTVTVTVTDDGGQSVSFSGTATVLAPWTALPGSGQVSADPERAQMVQEGEATVDVGQGALRLSHALDFDQSPGTSVGGDPALVYNSATVNVRPVIQLQIAGDPNAGAPTQAVVQLTWNGVQQPAVTYNLTQPAGSAYIFSVQPQSPVTATGQYSWSAKVTFTLPNNVTETTTASGTANVVVRDGSAYGAGWGIDGIDQLFAVSGGVLWVTGQGDSRFFQSNGNGTFTSPAEDFGALVQNGDGSYTYTDKGQNKSNFSSQGLLTSVVDTHGLTLLSYLYDTSNRLTQVNAIDGGTTLLSYDPSSGLLNSITEPGNRVLTLTHTGSDLTQILDVDGTTRSMQYNGYHQLTNDQWSPLDATFSYDPSSGLLTKVDRGLGTTYAIVSTASVGLGTVAGTGSPWASITDGLEHKTQYLLDNRGRLLQQILGDGSSTYSYVRDNAGQVVAAIDPLGRATLNTYVYGAYNPSLGGGAGDLVETTNADGSWIKYVYDPTFHNLTQTSNSLGQTTSSTYDPTTGDLLSSTDALNNTTTYTYYQQNGVSNGLVATVTSPQANGTATTTYLYDPSRRQIAVFDNLGVPTWSGYDQNGNLATTTDVYGRITQTLYSPDNLLLQQIDAEGGVTSWQYNPYGQQISQTNARDFTQQTSYDQRGWVTTQTDNLGNVIQTNSYDVAGNLIQQKDGDNNPTNYGFDADNRQTSVTDALNNTTKTAYDAAGNVTSTTDASQRTTTNGYDLLGRQIWTIDPMQRTSRTLYDSVGNAIRTTDPMGLMTLTIYDGNNRPIQVVTLLGNGQYQRTQTVYNPDGSAAQTIDPLGLASETFYDADGRVIGTEDPDGFTTATGYDLVGNVLWSRDANGKYTNYAYDELNQQISVEDADGNLTQTLYDTVGNAVQTIDPRTYASYTTFDADNRAVSVQDEDGYLSQTVYDTAGNVTASMDDNGQWTYQWYDADNRVVLVLDPDGNWTQTTYNAVGDTVSSVDGAGDVTQTAYNADDEETSSEDGAGNVTAYQDNADGQQISETDPDSNTTQYQRDAQGNIVAIHDPLGNTTTEQYDLDGRLLSKTDRDGRTILYGYDKDGRLQTETWYNANGSVQDTKTYSYDNNGNLLTATDSSGTVTETYDSDGQLLTQTDANGLKLTYGYDKAGNISSLQDSLGGLISKVYDGDGRLTSLQFSGPNGQQARQDMTYTKAGQLQTVTRYSDTAGTQKVGLSQYWYDKAGNVTHIQHQNGSGVVLGDFQYQLDTAERLSSETDTENGGSPVTTPYGYDKASQLTQAGSNGYTYDPNGNWTKTGYVTGPGNQLQNDGTWAYQYDQEGNTILQTNNSTRETWAYTWDDANHLTSATHKDSSGNLIEQVTFKYDVFGNLVERDDYLQSTGQTTVVKYANDAEGNMWADLSGTGALTMRRLFVDVNGQTQPALRIDASGNVAWYLTDHLGSVRLLANTAGTVIDQIDYDAYGNITNETQPANGDRYKYASGQYDPSLQATRDGERITRNGHWLSQDPSGLAPDANPYRYASDNPTNKVDPTGLEGINKYQKEAYDKAGLTPDGFRNDNLIPYQGRRNESPLDRSFVEQRLNAMQKIAKAYAELYKNNKDTFLWAGFGAIAVNDGVLPATITSLRMAGDPDVSGRVMALEGGKMFIGGGPLGASSHIARDGARAAFAVNAAIYLDLYWAHLAYLDGGLENLKKLNASETVIKAFSLIDQGIKANPRTPRGRRLIEEGNLKLFEREQREIVTPFFARYSYAMAEATKNGLIKLPNKALRSMTRDKLQKSPIWTDTYPNTRSYGPANPRWKWLSTIGWSSYLKLEESSQMMPAVERAIKGLPETK